MNRGPAHIVLIGPPRSGTSSIGSRFARQVNRPFIDIDASSVRPERPGNGHGDATEPGAHRSDLDDAECDWLRRVLATSGPLVIAAPWSAISVVEEFDEPERLWRVWLDAPDEVLLARCDLHDVGPGDDELRDYLRDHTHPHRDIAARVADVRLDGSHADPADLTSALVDRWLHRLGLDENTRPNRPSPLPD